MGVFAMKVTSIPIGIQFRHAGNGWGVFDLIEWDVLRLDLRADEDLDEPDGVVGGLPVGTSGVTAGETSNAVESLAVLPDDDLL